MANTLYDKGRQKFLDGLVSWTGDTIKVILVDIGQYTVNIASHEFLNSIVVGARIGSIQTLTGKTSTAGVADADDVTFPAVTGVTIEALVIYKDTGVEATSPLLVYIDTATGLAFVPNGGAVIITWDNGPARIFRL